MTALATAPRNALSPVAQPGPARFASPDSTTVLDLAAPGRVTTLDAPTRSRHTAVRVPNISRNIIVKIASEPEEWEQALKLVSSNYQSHGYEPANSHLIRFTPFQALPDSTTFIAKDEAGTVVGTVTLVLDNTLLGLPIDSLYGAEVAQLRRAGRKLGESISLAMGSLPLRESLPVLQALLRLKMHYHLSQGGDTWVMTVNPRHRNYYTKIMGYVPFGDCREYEAVQGAPAEAFWLDLPAMEQRVPKTFQEFFRTEPPCEAALRPAPMPTHLVRSFSSRSSRTDSETAASILTYLGNYGSPRRWEGA